MAAGPSEPAPGGAPQIVAALLGWPPLWLLARLMLVSAYLAGSLAKLADWPAAVTEQAHFGLHPAGMWAALTIAVELGGSLLLLSRRFVWLGAGMLGGFTLAAALIANAFWTMEGAERFAVTNAFLEHVGLVGGFILAALMAARMPFGAAPR